MTERRLFYTGQPIQFVDYMFIYIRVYILTYTVAHTHTLLNLDNRQTHYTLPQPTSSVIIVMQFGSYRFDIHLQHLQNAYGPNYVLFYIE